MSEPEVGGVVGGTFGRDFPPGSLLHQKVGQDFEWGYFRYLFTGILWERPDNGYGERQGLMKARDTLLGKNVFINLRILKNDEYESDDERADMIQRATEAFEYEVNTFRDLADTNHTPVVITSAKIKQNDCWEFPGGYLHLYVMEEYPLTSLEDAFDYFSEGDIPHLENALYAMLGIFFRYRLAYYAVDYEYKYDSVTGVLYAVDIQNFHEIRDLDDLEAAERYFAGIVRSLRRSIERKAARAEEARSRAMSSHSMFEGSVEHWEDINDSYPLTEFNVQNNAL